MVKEFKILTDWKGKPIKIWLQKSYVMLLYPKYDFEVCFIT